MGLPLESDNEFDESVLVSSAVEVKGAEVEGATDVELGTEVGAVFELLLPPLLLLFPFFPLKF